MFLRGGGKEPEALISMGGKDDDVKALACSRCCRDPSPIFFFLHCNNRIAETRLAQSLQHLFHIRAGTAIHREPRMVRGDSEKSMIMEEMEQRRCGEVEDATRLRRPDGGTHRNEVEIKEVAAKAVPLAECGQILQVQIGPLVRGVAFGFIAQPLSADTEESHDLGDQHQEADVADITTLGEDLVQPHAIVLESAGGVLHAEGHLARFDGDAEFSKETAEVGIGDLVEDDESRVDRDLPTLLLHGHRIRMTARSLLRLEEREIRDVA